MESTRPNNSIANDVLHLGGSKLTPEEIAKAVAHHKRNHGGQQQNAGGKAGSGKKSGGRKPGK